MSLGHQTILTQGKAWVLENQDLVLVCLLHTCLWVGGSLKTPLKGPTKKHDSKWIPTGSADHVRGPLGSHKGWRAKGPHPPMIPWGCGPGNVAYGFSGRIKSLLYA